MQWIIYEIYESFTFWNNLQEKINFHDILIYWDAPVFLDDIWCLTTKVSHLCVGWRAT